MATAAVQRAELIGTHTELGRGGLGTVYRLHEYTLPDHAGTVAYKEFHGPQAPDDLHQLRRLIDFRTKLDSTNRAALDEFFAWPLREVHEPSGTTVGLVLPLLDERYRLTIKDSGTTERRDAQLDYLFKPAEVIRDNGVPCPDDDDLVARLGLCRSMAKAFELLQANGLVYGDLSHKNALWTTDPAPHVFLIDCDAIRFESDPTRVQANTATWCPPEILHQSGQQSAATDNYKLALFFLRCLAPGGRGPQKFVAREIGGALNNDGRELLRRGLGPNPSERPTAAEWHAYLNDYLLQLTSPPVVIDLTVDQPTVLVGEPVTVRWLVWGADRIELTWPDGHREVFAGDADPGTMSRPVRHAGEVTIRVENSFGRSGRRSPMIRVFELPPMEKLVIPVPGLPPIAPQQWHTLSTLFDSLAGATSAARPVDVTFPSFPVLAIPAAPTPSPLPALTGLFTPDLWGGQHASIPVPSFRMDLALPPVNLHQMSSPAAKASWCQRLLGRISVEDNKE